MSSNTLNYGHLYSYLESLGYKAQFIEKHVVFRMPQRELPIILPKAAKTEEVRPSHLAAVERILVLDGAVGGGQLSSSMSRTHSSFKRSTANASHGKAAKSKASHFKAAKAKASHVKAAAKPKALHFKAAKSKASHVKAAAKAKGSYAKALKARGSES
jgi:hypothetical protein